jgi:hypothetical protein
MPIPEPTEKYYEKNLLDRVIDNVIARNNALTQSDFNRVGVAAQIQTGIDKYRAAAKTMSSNALEDEVHNSARLGRHLEEVGYKRPPRCHAHAIVAGKHKYSAQLRVLMASLKIRIDDADNGCFLPENTAATPHPAFPSAVPHSRIHREKYYSWVSMSLRSINQNEIFRIKLQIIARQLQYGTLPKDVLAINSGDSGDSGRTL